MKNMTLFKDPPMIIACIYSLIVLLFVVPMQTALAGADPSSQAFRMAGRLKSIQPLRVDKAYYPEDGDLTYQGGHVIDGIVNVYLIFWIDAAYQPVPSNYVSVIQRFIKDVGHSPLYHNLRQYTDSRGRYPTGTKLAGTFIDKSPLPAQMIAQRADPNVTQDQALTSKLEQLTGTTWMAKIKSVAKRKRWNMQDYHNLFVMLPSIGWDCGYHGVLEGQVSPWALAAYPYYKGQERCNYLPYAPNHQRATDIVVDLLSHELIESVGAPGLNGWEDKGHHEVADKCDLPTDTVNPQTQGDVTWGGHSYLVQEEYDNLRHGCVLTGP
jgi:hypothetical protein